MSAAKGEIFLFDVVDVDEVVRLERPSADGSCGAFELKR